MTTTPTGDPLWARNSDASTYGGHPEKRNYQSQDAVNPLTDVTAEEFIRLCADVAGLASVAPFAILTLTCNDATTEDPTVNSAFQSNGVSLNGYAGGFPPTGFPTCTRVSDGKVQVQWSQSQSDDYGVAYDLDLYHAHASVLGSSVFTSVVRVRVNGYTWTFEARDSASVAIPDAQMTIEIA